MKFKTTKKAMKESYNTIISIGYCDAEYLLRYENPIAYSTRAEGWACDYYDINNVLISTGYAPLANRHVNCSYKLIKEYDDKARAIACDYNIDWKKQQTKVKTLLDEFIKIATK